MKENEEPLNRLLRNADILISNLKRLEYEGMTTLDEAEKPYRDKSVERQREINSEYSIKIEGSKGTKHVNPNKNHDFQVSEHEYDPIKHFMEIQQASSTISKEKQQQETDLSQMD